MSGQRIGPRAERRRLRPTRVGLVGLGTVGGTVARLLATGRHPQLQLARVCTRPSTPRPAWLDAGVECTSRVEDLLAPDIDVFVELVGGLSPAREWVTRALLSGKSVVTANKQLIAEHGHRLSALAAAERLHLRFGASVAGGVPVVGAVREGLAGDWLIRLAGILNGTANYILNRIEDAGIGFDQALGEARALGYAEADSAADIEGFDARAKLVILCAVGLGCNVTPSDVQCASIASIGPADFARARERGCTIRQVSRAERLPGRSGGVRTSVGPEPVPLDSPFARARGPENVLVVSGELGGDTVYSGAGAGGNPTAVAVVSDLVAIAASHQTPAGSPWPQAATCGPLDPTHTPPADHRRKDHHA